MTVATTAPQAIRILWRENIFRKPKDVRSIEAELAQRGYNFTDKNLMMALKAVKFLTRRGEKGSYTYVQKHPFVEEAKNGKKGGRRKNTG
jgi:hypothetical protein